ISHSVMNVGIALSLDWCVTYHKGIIGTILNSRPLVSVGVISYSLYLWQQMFFNRYSTALMTTFPINITLVTAAAIASYFLIEKPCLRFRQHLEQVVFSASARVQSARAGAGGSVVPDGAA